MASQDWLDKLNNMGDKPVYQSKYQNTIDDLLNKISNREEFSYDFNADPLYQQYKDNYTKLGNEASMNAAANVANLTGGYGNSYAATAASQANQQYLTQLNNIIPQLQSAALDKYQMETDNLYNQYSAYGNAEDRAYGQYRDSVSDYYADRDYYTNGYNTDRSYEYQQERDAVSDSQWNQNFDYNKAIDERNYAYQKERDAISDAQWEKNYQLSLANSRKTGSKNDDYLIDFDPNKNAAKDAVYRSYILNVNNLKTKADKSYALEVASSLYDEGKMSARQYADLLHDTGLITDSEYNKLLKAGY